MPGLHTQAKDGDDSTVPTLAELITAQKTESGLSYEQYAAKTGFVVSRQRFHQLGTQTRQKEFPEPTTLAAVAKAIDVDVALVVLATAKSLGLDVERGMESDLAMMLPAATRDLTRRQRNAVLALIRSIVMPDDSSNDPHPKPGSALSTRLREGLANGDGGVHGTDDNEKKSG